MRHSCVIFNSVVRHLRSLPEQQMLAVWEGRAFTNGYSWKKYNRFLFGSFPHARKLGSAPAVRICHISSVAVSGDAC